METNPIRQTELAHRAGVSRSCAHKAMRGALRRCLTSDGKRIYGDDPAVKMWIAEHRAGRGTKEATGTGRNVTDPAPPPRVSSIGDPFAFAARAAAPLPARAPPPPELERALVPAAEPPSTTDQMLEELRSFSQGKLPPIADFRYLPFDEVLERYGTLEALMLAVKANKGYVELRVKEQEAAVKRGDLIERRIVTAVLAPIIDLAFSRLVGEAPTALREQVVARVLTGGTDLAIDVEEMIRSEVSGILTDAKSALQAEFDRLELA